MKLFEYNHFNFYLFDCATFVCINFLYVKWPVGLHASTRVGKTYHNKKETPNLEDETSLIMMTCALMRHELLAVSNAVPYNVSLSPRIANQA